MAVDIGFVMLVKVRTLEHKFCDLSAVLPEPDILQVAAHAHKKRTSKNIRGLKAEFRQ